MGSDQLGLGETARNSSRMKTPPGVRGRRCANQPTLTLPICLSVVRARRANKLQGAQARVRKAHPAVKMQIPAGDRHAPASFRTRTHESRKHIEEMMCRATVYTRYTIRKCKGVVFEFQVQLALKESRTAHKYMPPASDVTKNRGCSKISVPINNANTPPPPLSIAMRDQ